MSGSGPHGEGEAEVEVLRGLRASLFLSGGVLALEAVGAYFSHSLTLTLDAFHDVPDLLAFAASWQALASAARGASLRHTFGRHRTEVLAAVLNATLILATAFAFGYEALVALLSRTALFGPVDPVWIVAAAVPALVLRTYAARLVVGSTGSTRDVNLRSVLLHLWADVAITVVLLGTAATLAWRPGLTWVDPLAALGVAGLLVYESLPLFRDSWSALSEQAPAGLSMEALERAAREVPHVQELHDLHVWSVCSSFVCMTAHVRIEDLSVREGMAVVAELKRRFARDFGIVHAVLEVETGAPGIPGSPPGGTCAAAG